MRMMMVVMGGLMVLTVGCSGPSTQVVPVKEQQSADDAPRERKIELKSGSCWDSGDCDQFGNTPMCSLQHNGAPPPPLPDECASDDDCKDPTTRCVMVGAHLACSPPGVCEACCRP